MKKTFKTLKQVFEACENQVNAQQVLNGQLYLKGKGWTSVDIAPELREQIIDKIVSTAGGRQNTKERAKNSFNYSTPKHWAIARFLLSSYPQVNNGEPYFSYCAGQDMSFEMKELRKFLSK